jgi:macrolide-specific efflux system membrane fusion protein
MKRRILWINLALALVIVAAGVGGYLWLFAPKETVSTGRTVNVQSGAVSETVTATGTVETAGTVEMSFGSGGTVTTVKVAQGDTVKVGKALVSIDDAAARQGLYSARASYVQAATGTQKSSLTLAAARQAVTNARASAQLNRQGYEQAARQARTALKDAKGSWSASCLDPAGTCPDDATWAALRSAEADVSGAKTAYDQAVQTASTQETTNTIRLNQASVNLAETKARQDTACNTYGSSATQCTSAVDATRSAQQQYDLLVNSNATAAIQSQQSLVNADARITTANITLRKLQTTLPVQAQDAITAAEQSLKSALLQQEKGVAADAQSIQNAEQSLSSLEAASAAVSTGAGGSITADQAAVDVARAGLTQARETLADTTLRAPVAGTVAAVDATVGASAPAGTTMVTIIPDASYQIVADFSEADAMKVAVGQAATVTFDALTDGTATGTVTAVDILPTTGSSVTTYGATITLSEVPDGLRDGMSASVVVTVAEATGVLWAPTAAITTAGGQSTVTIRKDGVETTVVVTTGLAGDTGTEILSGVAEGDALVVTTTGSTGSSNGFPMGGIPGGGFTGGGAPPMGGGPQ